MKLRLAFASLLITAGPLARSQAAPAATSGGADLRYVLRYSETAQFAHTLGTWHTINTSGSLNYANGRSRSPFNLDYSGGYTSTLSGPPYSTGPFHHLLVSQGLDWRKWFMNFSDDVGYRRQAPITGFSGIPGTGEPIAGGNNPVSSQFILTVNTPVVSNDASGELRHIVNHSATISVDAHHSLLRFVNGYGLDTDQLKIGAGPTFRLNARNSLIAQYEFSQFTYPDYDVQFQTHAVTFGYDKIWNRAFHSVVSAGPDGTFCFHAVQCPYDIIPLEALSNFYSYCLSREHVDDGRRTESGTILKLVGNETRSAMRELPTLFENSSANAASGSTKRALRQSSQDLFQFGVILLKSMVCAYDYKIHGVSISVRLA